MSPVNEGRDETRHASGDRRKAGGAALTERGTLSSSEG